MSLLDEDYVISAPGGSGFLPHRRQAGGDRTSQCLCEYYRRGRRALDELGEESSGGDIHL